MAGFNFKYLVIMVLCVALSPLPVLSEPGKFVPFVSIKQEYSDNILFSTNNEEEDFITTGTAGLTYSYDSERVDARINGRILHRLYKDNDQLDTTDGNASATWNYQYTEKLGFGAFMQYRNDSRRDRDTDTTGLVLSGDREGAKFSVSSNYMLSELTRGEIEVSYGLEDIDETLTKEDNDTINISINFSKNLSKTFDNTTGLLNLSYMHYTSDYEILATNLHRDYTSDVVQVYAGFSKDITELYNFYLQAGASYTDTKETTLIGSYTIDDQDGDNFGGVLLAGLNYDGLYYDAGLSVSHDVREGSGTNGTVERSAISLEIDRKVSDGFFLTLDTSCYLNENERKTSEDLEEYTINVQPGFRYRFWDTFTLSGVYRYTSVKDKTNDSTSERNLIYFVIKKEFEL
ncbi:MAG: hypothetical protein GY857_19510 [Desulfobacula sp.]|nr:hypothetical protein [Desulfobacula sp.]